MCFLIASPFHRGRFFPTLASVALFCLSSPAIQPRAGFSAHSPRPSLPCRHLVPPRKQFVLFEFSSPMLPTRPTRRVVMRGARDSSLVLPSCPALVSQPQVSTGRFCCLHALHAPTCTCMHTHRQKDRQTDRRTSNHSGTYISLSMHLLFSYIRGLSYSLVPCFSRTKEVKVERWTVEDKHTNTQTFKYEQRRGSTCIHY